MTPTLRLVHWILLSACLLPARAEEAAIEFAMLEAHDGSWTISVTLRHADTGWDHYADAWRVVDGDGTVLGRRVLAHPHVDEQPFTRGQSGIRIPADTPHVYIEAHDTVHGWSAERLAVDLARPEGTRYRISRQ